MDTSAIIKRLKEYFCVTSDTQLSAKMGLSSAGVSAWRQRDSVNLNLVEEQCPDIDWNWLVRGKSMEDATKSMSDEVLTMLREQKDFYKDAYEKKCAELDAANKRIDMILEKVSFIQGGLVRSVSMLSDGGTNNYSENNVPDR